MMIGLSFASLIGWLQVLGAIGYFAISVGQIIATSQAQRQSEQGFRIMQTIVVPPLLLLSGVVLIFNGWRLDPLLQFQALLITGLIGYLIFMDVVRSRNG